MPPLLHDGLIDTDALSFEQTIRRAWVHKRSLDNVLLTEIRACADDTFLCAGRLPTAHCFFNDAGRTPYSDILFYTEIGRQASLAISHAFLGVGTDDVFVFEGSEAAVTAAAWRKPEAAAAVVIEVRVRDLVRRKNTVSRVVTELTMHIGGERVFRGTGAFSIQSAALFQRLRKASAATIAGAAPEEWETVARAAGLPRASGANVAISSPRRGSAGAGVEAALIVDPTHPYFFDHPCDHVPGMLLLEGCAQLAQVAFTRTTQLPTAGVAAYDISFNRFVECSAQTTLTAHVDGSKPVGALTSSPAVCLLIAQQGTVCGAATMHLEIPASH
jgi:hypothetical protein